MARPTYEVYWKHGITHRGKVYRKGRVWKHIFRKKSVAIRARRSMHNTAAGAKHWFGIRKRR